MQIEQLNPIVMFYLLVTLSFVKINLNYISLFLWVTGIYNDNVHNKTTLLQTLT